MLSKFLVFENYYTQDNEVQILIWKIKVLNVHMNRGYWRDNFRKQLNSLEPLNKIDTWPMKQ